MSVLKYTLLLVSSGEKNGDITVILNAVLLSAGNGRKDSNHESPLQRSKLLFKRRVCISVLPHTDLLII